MTSHIFYAVAKIDPLHTKLAIYFSFLFNIKGPKKALPPICNTAFTSCKYWVQKLKLISHVLPLLVFQQAAIRHTKHAI